MNDQIHRIGFYVLALILIAALLGPGASLSGKPALAQEVEMIQASLLGPDAPDALISPRISYQGKLLESGVPVDDSRSMTFRLYNLSVGGSALWTEGPRTVSVSNGLFTVSLGDNTALVIGDFDQQLWLEIQVGAVTLPRQVLQGAPYALSLAPGADISGSSAGDILYVYNSSNGVGLKGSSATGYGVLAESNGSGLPGAAMYAHNTHSSGVSLWAYNSSLSNNNATMALSNDGSGDLLRGFGGDGGEDEFRFKNDGTFQNKAPTYIFVPGVEARPTDGAAVTVTPTGSAGMSWIRPSAVSSQKVTLAVVLPSVLYGQQVEIEEVRIYYRISDSTSYITSTKVEVLDVTGATVTMVSELLNHDSVTYSNYAMIPTTHATLTADEGIFGIQIECYFQSTSHFIILGGVRIKLRHHPLY